MTELCCNEAQSRESAVGVSRYGRVTCRLTPEFRFPTPEGLPEGLIRNGVKPALKVLSRSFLTASRVVPRLLFAVPEVFSGAFCYS